MNSEAAKAAEAYFEKFDEPTGEYMKAARVEMVKRMEEYLIPYFDAATAELREGNERLQKEVDRLREMLIGTWPDLA